MSDQVEKNNQDVKRVEESVIRVLGFFDLFSFPLTEIEIWERLGVQCEFDVFLDALKGIERVESSDGFYFLQNRREIVKRRQEQYIVSQEKWKIARRAGQILRNVYGVKMMAVCNNFSYKKESDIDIFVVVRKNRMWLTRFMVTLNMQLAGLRRHGKKIANRICLSFYVSESDMNLEQLLLPVSGKYGEGDFLERDPYFVFWMHDLLPLYDDGVMEQFWQKNSWLKELFPNFSPVFVSQRIRVLDNVFSSTVKKFVGVFLNGFLGNVFENLARVLQKKKMSKNKYSLSKEKDSRVVVSDTILKFHEEDRREFYRGAWVDNVQE